MELDNTLGQLRFPLQLIPIDEDRKFQWSQRSLDADVDKSETETIRRARIFDEQKCRWTLGPFQTGNM